MSLKEMPNLTKLNQEIRALHASAKFVFDPHMQRAKLLKDQLATELKQINSSRKGFKQLEKAIATANKAMNTLADDITRLLTVTHNTIHRRTDELVHCFHGPYGIFSILEQKQQSDKDTTNCQIDDSLHKNLCYDNRATQTDLTPYLIDQSTQYTCPATLPYTDTSTSPASNNHDDPAPLQMVQLNSAQTQTDFEILATSFQHSTPIATHKPSRKPRISNHINTSSSFSSPIANKKSQKFIIYNVDPKIKDECIIQAFTNATKLECTELSIYKYLKSKHKEAHHIIVEAYSNVVLQDKCIIICNKKYKVDNYIFVQRCYRCQQLNHSARVCTNKPVCACCAQSHTPGPCMSTTPACRNCLHNNFLFNTSFNIYHPAYDSNCPSFRAALHGKRYNLSLTLSSSCARHNYTI